MLAKYGFISHYLDLWISFDWQKRGNYRQDLPRSNI